MTDAGRETALVRHGVDKIHVSLPKMSNIGKSEKTQKLHLLYVPPIGIDVLSVAPQH